MAAQFKFVGLTLNFSFSTIGLFRRNFQGPVTSHGQSECCPLGRPVGVNSDYPFFFSLSFLPSPFFLSLSFPFFILSLQGLGDIDTNRTRLSFTGKITGEVFNKELRRFCKNTLVIVNINKNVFNDSMHFQIKE